MACSWESRSRLDRRFLASSGSCKNSAKSTQDPESTVTKTVCHRVSNLSRSTISTGRASRSLHCPSKTVTEIYGSTVRQLRPQLSNNKTYKRAVDRLDSGEFGAMKAPYSSHSRETKKSHSSGHSASWSSTQIAREEKISLLAAPLILLPVPIHLPPPPMLLPAKLRHQALAPAPLHLPPPPRLECQPSL
jgi:hypothetical protein